MFTIYNKKGKDEKVCHSSVRTPCSTEDRTVTFTLRFSVEMPWQTHLLLRERGVRHRSDLHLRFSYFTKYDVRGSVECSSFICDSDVWVTRGNRGRKTKSRVPLSANYFWEYVFLYHTEGTRKLLYVYLLTDLPKCRLTISTVEVPYSNRCNSKD